MAQRARRHFHAWSFGGFGMSLQPAVQAAKRAQFLYREEAAMRQHRIQHRASMAFGEDEPVTIGPMRIIGVDAQMVKIQRGQYFRDGECAADVAGLAFVDHSQDLGAIFVGPSG